MTAEQFHATHTVPVGGLTTYAQPGAAEAGPRVGDHLPVMVLRTWGDWAEIECDNGWTAWLDARRLVPIGAVTPTAVAAPVASRGPWISPSAATAATLAGSGLLVVSGMLDWIKGQQGADGVAGLDVPLAFLVDYENGSDGGPGVGITLILLGIAAAVLRHLAGKEAWARAPGGIALSIAVLFVLQINRWLGALDDAGMGDVPGLLDTVGIGVWLTVLGAGLVLWGGPSTTRAPR